MWECQIKQNGGNPVGNVLSVGMSDLTKRWKAGRECVKCGRDRSK